MARLTLEVETPEDYHVYNFTPNVVRDALELLEKYKDRVRSKASHI
jgi:hypothetical protein